MGLNAATEGLHFGAHHVHADTAPSQLGHLGGGRETRRKDEVGHLGIAQHLVRRDEPLLQGTLANARQVEASAVIAELDRDVVAGLLHIDADQACRILAARGTHGLRFDAMHHAVAQQMLERGRHAVQNAAVHLDRATRDVQTHLLAGFLGCLAHHAIQPLGDALELDHARAQQIALQLTRLPGLGRQIVFAGLHSTLQAALHRGHVVHRLGHDACQLLHARETVELEWIEVLLRILGQGQSRLHLRLGLQLDVAQLKPQTLQVAG